MPSKPSPKGIRARSSKAPRGGRPKKKRSTTRQAPDRSNIASDIDGIQRHATRVLGDAKINGRDLERARAEIDDRGGWNTEIGFAWRMLHAAKRCEIDRKALKLLALHSQRPDTLCALADQAAHSYARAVVNAALADFPELERMAGIGGLIPLFDSSRGRAAAKSRHENAAVQREKRDRRYLAEVDRLQQLHPTWKMPRIRREISEHPPAGCGRGLSVERLKKVIRDARARERASVRAAQGRVP